MFYDLNVPYSPDDPEVPHTLNFLAELGYTTVALSQTINGKLPASLTPPHLPANPPKSLQLLTRLNLTLADPAQNQRLAVLTQAYDLVALRPTNEKSLLNAWSGLDARRNLIGNATSLIRATRGRGIIVSSEARRALSLRAPWDVINLTCVWGLSQERGKEAICEETRKVIALAKLKRTSWRGIVDVVHGGEKVKAESAAQNQKAAPKSREPTESDTGADNLKRKASISSEPIAEDPDKPLSKREIKRRAKKAKFDAKGGNAT
ncbi:hypothetical protein N7485_010150 [Penicillium canescens]|nr:hypothetical protein N7485_010150 [Penicillium canescens]